MRRSTLILAGAVMALAVVVITGPAGARPRKVAAPHALNATLVSATAGEPEKLPVGDV
jgi:hypothetical protein